MNALKKIQLTQELIGMFIENTPIAYIILDEDRRIHYINKSFLELRKLDFKSTMGEYCYNISNGGVPCDNCAVEKTILSREPNFVSRCDNLPDGTTRYIDDYAFPLENVSDDGHQYTLEIMVNRSVEMQYKEKRNKDFESLVAIISELLESKDTYTAMHSYNVHTIAYHIACAMNLSEEEIFNISMAAKLHDIGKVGIPNSIINKPSRLTDEEFEIIKSHPVRSYEMIKNLESFSEIAEIVRHHHERIDGKGYPDGLKGDELSLGAKIVAVADTFEAMTSDRSYRKALPIETALKELRRVSGTQLDAEVVAVFESLHFNYNTYEPATTSKGVFSDEKLVGRKLKRPELSADKKNWSVKELEHLDKNKILQQIFEKTPCGYVLMSPDNTVLYASPFFLEYMGLEEEDVVGQKCYQASDKNGTACEDCAVKVALEKGQTYKIRRSQETKNGYKTFDMYGIPLKTKDGVIEYLIEVIMDRTEEAKVEKARLSDYKTLFNTLTRLLQVKGTDEDDKEMIDKIPELKNKLKTLFHDLPD